jgi:hypothetical protein
MLLIVPMAAIPIVSTKPRHPFTPPKGIIAMREARKEAIIGKNTVVYQR